MKKLLTREIYPLVFGLLILTVFIAHFFHPEQNPHGLGSDTYEYWHLSTNLLKYKEFVYTDLSYYPPFDLPESIINNYAYKKVPCTVRMPGYPFILAISRGVWDSVWVAVILVYVTYIGVCLYGFRLGALFLPKSTHQWFFNFLLVSTPVYLTRWGVGSDLPASFFIAGFAYHVFRQFHLSCFSMRHTFLACLWATLANFTRVNLLIFTFILLTAVFILGIVKNKRKTCYAFFLILLIVSASLGLWGLRNKQVCDHWTLSSQGGAVLYTVHLFYGLSPEDPLYYWSEKGRGRANFFNKEIHKGKTFNQIEISLDKKLKVIVWNYYKNNPFQLLKNWSNGLRTFFMFSYFDISDLIVYLQKPLGDCIQYVQNAQRSLTQGQLTLWKVLFQISRIYKIIMAVVFFLVPGLFFLRKEKNDNYFSLMALYAATFLGVLATAFFTGAAGDRMRMPFNVFILIFVVWFFTVVKSYVISILNKTSEN